jgi:hypothetical protein
VSSIDLDISGIVPYFTNEDRIEQIFGLSKTNDMLKPIENPTIDHLRGHALINFLATCTHMGIDSHFDETELLAKNAFFSLCLLTATLKSTKLCVSEPNESMNEYLKILNIPIPKPMYLKNNSCVDGNYYNL